MKNLPGLVLGKRLIQMYLLNINYIKLSPLWFKFRTCAVVLTKHFIDCLFLTKEENDFVF